MPQNGQNPRLIEIEHRELMPFLNLAPQGTLLQMGGTTPLFRSDAWLVSPESPRVMPSQLFASTGQIQCDFLQLPFEFHSISFIVLVHVLEYCEDPERLLQEVNRVLRPGGYIISLGFNYWSIESLMRVFKKQRQSSPTHFYSIWRIKRWLEQMNFLVLNNKSFGFALPWRVQVLSQTYRWLEMLGQMIMPKTGAVHLIYARKHSHTVTPILNTIRTRSSPLTAIAMHSLISETKRSG